MTGSSNITNIIITIIIIIKGAKVQKNVLLLPFLPLKPKYLIELLQMQH